MNFSYELFLQNKGKRCQRIGRWSSHRPVPALPNFLFGDVEKAMAPLMTQGIEGASFTLAIGNERESSSLELTPWQIGRLSSLGLNLNLGPDPSSCLEETGPERRKVRIDQVDILADSDSLEEEWGPHQLKVQVALDDRTLWEGYYYTLEHVRRSLQFQRLSKSGLAWFSGNDYVVMEHLGREEIEYSIAALIQQGRFEQVFKRVDGLEKLAPKVHTGVELRVLHPARYQSAILDLPGMENWRPSIGEQCSVFRGDYPDQEPDNAFFHKLLDQVESHKHRLEKMGIGRQDLRLKVHFKYDFQESINLSPAVISRMRRIGFYLDLRLSPLEVAVARCLD